MKKWTAWFVGSIVLVVGLYSIAMSEIPYQDINGNAQSSTRAVVRCIKGTAGMLPQGTAVCITGYDSTYDCATVEAADADNLTLGPCVGILTGNVAPTLIADCTVAGNVGRLNTNSFTAGDTLYLSTASTGTLTATAPTGTTARVQRVATVIRKDAKDGIICVSAGSPATVPNAIIAVTGQFGNNTTLSINSNGTVTYSTNAFTLTADGNIDSDGHGWFGTSVHGATGVFDGWTTSGGAKLGNSTSFYFDNGTLTNSATSFTLTADGNIDNDGTLTSHGLVTLGNTTTITANNGSLNIGGNMTLTGTGAFAGITSTSFSASGAVVLGNTTSFTLNNGTITTSQNAFTMRATGDVDSDGYANFNSYKVGGQAFSLMTTTINGITRNLLYY